MVDSKGPIPGKKEEKINELQSLGLNKVDIIEKAEKQMQNSSVVNVNS